MTSSAMLCALACVVASTPPRPTPSPTPVVRTYTNADLDRLNGRADRNGAGSQPAHRLPRPAVDRGRPGPGDEQRWREQAQRLRERLDRIDDEVRDLRLRIEQRRDQPGVRPYTDPRIAAWEERARLLEQRKGELWSRFQRRARRARIPPGWLR